MKEDFLFPMSNRLSYASSPESDIEMRVSMYEDEDDEPSPGMRRRLMRSSSDPSINTGENIPGIPPYPAPPSYGRGHPAHAPMYQQPYGGHHYPYGHVSLFLVSKLV